MARPIATVARSTTLPARANRSADLVAAPVCVLVSVGHAVLAMVVHCAWTWPRTAGHPAVPQEGVRVQR